MDLHDPDLQELAHLDRAYKDLAARRLEAIRRIARRGRRGDQKAMSEITGYHRETIATIGARTTGATT